MKFQLHTLVQREQGFTLFGLLLYITLTSVILIALGDLTIGVLSLNARADRDRSTVYTLSFLQAKLGYDIGRAESIVAPTVATPSSSLILFSGGETVTYFLDEGRFWMQTSSSVKTPLTPETVVIAASMFETVSLNATKKPLRWNVQTAIHDPLRPDILIEHSPTTLTWYSFDYE